jgi:hypothetical protein
VGSFRFCSGPVVLIFRFVLSSLPFSCYCLVVSYLPRGSLRSPDNHLRNGRAAPRDLCRAPETRVQSAAIRASPSVRPSRGWPSSATRTRSRRVGRGSLGYTVGLIDFLDLYSNNLFQYAVKLNNVHSPSYIICYLWEMISTTAE